MKIAIVSDIHANIDALNAVIKDIDKQDCSSILLLGDLVGYYYSAKQVISIVRNDQRFIVIRGNHEDIFARTLVDDVFEKKMYQKYGSGFRSCLSSLAPDEIDWLKNLPVSKSILLDGLKIGMFHGSDKSTNEYIYPDAENKRLEKMTKEFDFVFLGHTHYPAIFMQGHSTIINPGSVGQPRDIGSLASYAILNTQNRSVVFRRVPFSSVLIQKKCEEIDPHYPYLKDVFIRNNPYAKNYK